MTTAASARATAAGLAKHGAALLRANAVDEPEQHSELLLAFALGKTRPEMKACAAMPVPPAAEKKFLKLLSEKARGVPLAYITGSQQFFEFDITVNPGVLIPRPETEGLAELAVKMLPEKAQPRILDLCTGSGCVACYLAAKLPHAEVTASDISAQALETSRANAKKLSLKIRFIESDLFENLNPAFDLIVSNPPYIPTAELPGLQKEVLREPRLALDGGKDGLSLIRRIAKDAPRFLAPGGTIVLEHGKGQSAETIACLASFQAKAFRDIYGAERYACGRQYG